MKFIIHYIVLAVIFTVFEGGLALAKERDFDRLLEEVKRDLQSLSLPPFEIELNDSFVGRISVNARALPFRSTWIDRTGRIVDADFSRPAIQIDRALTEAFWTLSQTLALSLRDGDWLDSNRALLDAKERFHTILRKRMGADVEEMPPFADDPRLKLLTEDVARSVLIDAEYIFKDALSAVIAHELSHLQSIPRDMIEKRQNEGGGTDYYIRPEWRDFPACLVHKDEIEADIFAYHVLKRGITRKNQMIGMIPVFLFLQLTAIQKTAPASVPDSLTTNCSPHPTPKERANLVLALAGLGEDFVRGHLGDTDDIYRRGRFFDVCKVNFSGVAGSNPQSWTRSDLVPKVIGEWVFGSFDP